MLQQTPATTSRPRVVIAGFGFAGLEAARTLSNARVQITVVDRRNHHLFQPLLYQVASATLSPADIAAPIRHVLRKQANAEVMLAEVEGIDLAKRRLIISNGETLAYDFLILATGASHSYFGREEWSRHAPGLKTLEDALEIRRRVLLAFERAEHEQDPAARRALLTFVVVGGGPTGVELAGTLKEMARLTLPKEFHRIRTDRARVLLVEAGPSILPSFGTGLSEKALVSLEKIGVEVRLGQSVTVVDEEGVSLGDERIPARTIIWAAGVTASHLGQSLGIPRDRNGRLIVEPDLSIAGHPEVFVAGDLASFSHGLPHPLPGVAPVAIQQGRTAAWNILAALGEGSQQAFRYSDKGSMATIGRAAAIAQLGPFRFAGFAAWLAWLFVHLLMLVGFRNRLAVLLEWFGAYLTTQRRARLILGPPVGPWDERPATRRQGDTPVPPQ